MESHEGRGVRPHSSQFCSTRSLSFVKQESGPRCHLKSFPELRGLTPRRPRGRTVGSSNLALCWFLLLRPSLELVLLSAYRLRDGYFPRAFLESAGSPELVLPFHLRSPHVMSSFVQGSRAHPVLLLRFHSHPSSRVRTEVEGFGVRVALALLCLPRSLPFPCQIGWPALTGHFYSGT